MVLRLVTSAVDFGVVGVTMRLSTNLGSDKRFYVRRSRLQDTGLEIQEGGAEQLALARSLRIDGRRLTKGLFNVKLFFPSWQPSLLCCQLEIISFRERN